MQRLDFRAMGCQMLALLDSEDANDAEALMRMPIWFEEWEASLSRFREESELSELNRTDGKPFRASETMWQVIETAMRAAHDSEGLVTPTLLDALETAGYDRSFESIKLAGDGTIAAEPRFDWRAIQLDEATRTVRLPRGMRLEFGGVAKGWAAEQAARRLSAIAPALVDAGGDIAVSGPKANGDAWPIGVADPIQPDADVELLMIQRGGVATSGRDYRKWERNGKWQHHIIDPRTGRPAQTDILSATVVAPTLMQAEVGAKAALILGSKAGLEWIDAREDFAAVLVLEDGQKISSRGLGNYVWSETSTVLENAVVPLWS